MKKILTFMLMCMLISCTVVKPPVVVTPTKVPNIMSRSVSSMSPTVSDITLRDSVIVMTKRMDTIIYNTHNTVKYQNKVIDTLWKRQGQYESTIDYQKKTIDSLKGELARFKTTWYDPEYFKTWGGATDSVTFLKPKPVLQTLGRTATTTTNYVYLVSPSWLSYQSINTTR